MIEAEANRIVYGKTIAELGDSDSRIVVLDADVSKSTNTFHFASRHPERFFNMGTAEQNLISFSAGLATTGKIPFASTFCIFASVRAAEQVPVQRRLSQAECEDRGQQRGRGDLR